MILMDVLSSLLHLPIFHPILFFLRIKVHITLTLCLSSNDIAYGCKKMDEFVSFSWLSRSFLYAIGCTARELEITRKFYPHVSFTYSFISSLLRRYAGNISTLNKTLYYIYNLHVEIKMMMRIILIF